MEVKAKLRFLRIAPRKVRLVADLIRAKSALAAESQLSFMPKGSARPMLKLLNSAVANAENNFKLKKDNLYIKRIMVDEGPKLKRWRPRAFGRAAPILKRSSHITIILDELKVVPPKTKGKAKAKTGKTSLQPTPRGVAVTKEAARPLVDFKEIKHESKGKTEASTKPEEQKKKPLLNFKNIKDRFTRRLGER